MARSRKKTFPAIARLSRAALEIMERAFLQGPGVRSVKSIVEEIEKQAGEKIDDNAVYRYREYWLSEERPFIEGRRQADAMLAALKDSPTGDLEELVKQRLTLAQVLNAKRLDGADPIELGYLATSEKRVEIQRERNRLLKERTENDRDKIRLLERNVAVRERQIKQAVKEVEKIGTALKIPPEKMAQIKEQFYGIIDVPAH